MGVVLIIECNRIFGTIIDAAQAVEAEEISGANLVESHRGIESVGRLFDGRFMESVEVRSGGYLTLRHGSGIGSLYILLDQEDRGYTLTNEATGETHTMDPSGFVMLSDFVLRAIR